MRTHSEKIEALLDKERFLMEDALVRPRALWAWQDRKQAERDLKHEIAEIERYLRAIEAAMAENRHRDGDPLCVLVDECGGLTLFPRRRLVRRLRKVTDADGGRQIG